MCVEALIRYRSGAMAVCTSIRGLRRALACDPVIAEGYEDGGIPPDSPTCLCPVDMEATAARAGWTARESAEWPGEWELVEGADGG